jgi:ABC-2 type transport system permease protein
MRAVATNLPAWEIAAAIALLVAGMLGVVWIAGKIYRVGILSTGKKPSFGELIRWLRMA